MRPNLQSFAENDFGPKSSMSQKSNLIKEQILFQKRKRNWISVDVLCWLLICRKDIFQLQRFNLSTVNFVQYMVINKANYVFNLAWKWDQIYEIVKYWLKFRFLKIFLYLTYLSHPFHTWGRNNAIFNALEIKIFKYFNLFYILSVTYILHNITAQLYPKFNRIYWVRFF